MRAWLALSAILAALVVGAAPPDAGVPAKAQSVPKAAPDAGQPKLSKEDEQLINDLELLENLEVIQKLDQVDVDQD